MKWSKKFFFGLLCVFFPGSAGAQNLSVEQEIIDKFIYQANLFPQEKIHIHTDKPDYVAGERIWFRAHLVNALSHEPIRLSRYVYVELLSPLNIVVRRVKVRQSEKSHHGYIDIPEDMTEGRYTLRAYTHYMTNLGEEYFHRSIISIANPNSLKFDVVPTFEYPGRDRVEVTLTFMGHGRPQKIEAGEFDIKFSNNPVTSFRTTSDSTARFTLRPAGQESRVLYVGYGGFRKYYYIPCQENDFSVDFFPEGGYLVPGAGNRVAFKALQPDGNPAVVTGVVKNGAGSEVAAFTADRHGMGVFTITCEEGQKYTAECKTAAGFLQVFDLPAPDSRASVIRAHGQNDRLDITVNGNRKGKNKNLYILGHCRGYPFFIGSADTETGNTLSIPISELPSGVLHFLLIDRDQNVLSERLVFSYNQKGFQPLAVDIPAGPYGRRGKITVGLDMPEGSDSAAYVSLSVTDDADIDPAGRLTIAANLLMNSDLRGTIPANSVFLADGRFDAELADMVMMVNGWRRYDVPGILAGDYTEPAEPVEIGQEISGTVRTLIRKQPVRGTEVSVIVPQASLYEQTATDEDGKFVLNNFELADSCTFIVQALSLKGNDKVELLIDEVIYPQAGIRMPPLFRSTGLKSGYVEKSDRKFVMENGMRIIDIEGVQVRGIKVEQQKGFMSDMADASFTLKDIEEIDATCLHELFRRIPGVEMYNDNLYIRGASSIFGESKAALYIDGVFVEGDFDLHVVQMPDVARVDVFKTGSTNVFGAKGGNGVLSITTKTGNFTPPENPGLNVKRLSPLGFQKPAEFYSPRYDAPRARDNALPDLRTTIHWEPDVTVGSEAHATVGFYSADYPTTYTLTIEGVSSEGRIICQSHKIEVE